MRILVATTTLAVAIAAGCGGNGDDDGDLSAEEVVEGLRAAGLPIEDVTVYDETSDPNELLGRPGQYTGKAAWRDDRVDPDLDVGTEGGGDVETFGDDDALEQRADYLEGFSTSSLLGWYQFEAGNAILRVSQDLTPDQADEYEAALQELYQ
jgi:hypothetical protein